MRDPNWADVFVDTTPAEVDEEDRHISSVGEFCGWSDYLGYTVECYEGLSC